MYKALPLLFLLACCTPRDLSALAKDPNTASFHDTFSGFGVTETIDYVRSGTPGATAAASSTGTTINQPNNITGTLNMSGVTTAPLSSK